MKLSFFIALRYLFSKQSTSAINIISLISMFAMGIGAMALIVILSVFNGFEGLVKGLYDGFYPDLQIQAAEGKVFKQNQVLETLTNNPEIEHFSFVLEENAHLKYGNRDYIAKVKGIDSNYYKVNKLEDFIVYGSPNLDKNGILIGAGIDYELDIRLDHGSQLTLSVPKRGKKTAIVASQLFNRAQVLPSGVFAIQQEFDNGYAFVPISIMRKLLNYKNQITSVDIKLKNAHLANSVKQNLLESLGADFKVKTRFEQDKAIYKVMKMERFAIFVILAFIVAIISFNIIGSLSMLAIEKRKDISIMKAMGSTEKNIRLIYLLEGFLVSTIGALGGLLLGILIVLAQKLFGFIKFPPGSTFVVKEYPVELRLTDIALTFLIIFLIGIIAAWFPAKRAGKQAMNFSE